MEDEEGWVVREQEEGGPDGVSTFNAQPPPFAAAACAPFLFRIVGGGRSGGGGVALGGNEGGIAVAPDPLSMYRAPVDLLALGGRLDMEELMRVTVAQREGRGGGDSESSDEEEEEEEQEAE